MSQIEDLYQVRMFEPDTLRARLDQRKPHPGIVPGKKLLIIALDHPARGALRAGADPQAMADRVELLRRTQIALGRPGVDGFLGTAEMVEDLAWLGALEGKLVFGSMNRGGIAGAGFEIDDRFTGYDAQGIADAGLDGGKMLLRIDPQDPSTARTMESCAQAVSELASRGLWAMVEPFISRRVDGVLSNDLTPEAVINSIAIAAGLGRTSSRTILKLPAVSDIKRVMAATMLPALILGGEVSPDAGEAEAQWAEALSQPNVQGLVIGRSLLFPADGDVAAAVDRAVGLL